MDFSLVFHTIRHLRLTQILYQVKYRLKKAKYVEMKAPFHKAVKIVQPIDKPHCSDGDCMTFLNLSAPADWNYTGNGMLWAYNMNYFDWLNQEGFGSDEGEKWISQFIKELPQNRIGLDPYPIALRGMNWIKFFCLHHINIVEFDDSLFSQYSLLSKKLEYHLLGNHLLEDAYSLFIASIYFQDQSFYQLSSRLLQRELDEQVLPDGAHFEQSPMYHCILLDRLLDCYNFSVNNRFFDGQESLNSYLKEKAELMLGHLDSITWNDGVIPLLNDSAYGIAPTPTQLSDYAKRLGLNWKMRKMAQCGYRKLQNEQIEAFIDVGNITANYQPGHSHADTFNYELRIDGNPFIVDTGISTYNKTKRRQLERCTRAHNTVTVKGQNSSEVWGGFRVGNRCEVELLLDEATCVKARHNGFGKNNLHIRQFNIDNNSFTITDQLSGNGENWIHFAPEVEILNYNNGSIQTSIGTIVLKGALRVDIFDGKISTEYNGFRACKIAKIEFNKEMEYRIS